MAIAHGRPLPSQEAADWQTATVYNSMYPHLMAAIRELDGQRHELRLSAAASRNKIHLLWKRIAEQRHSLDAAIARAKAAEAALREWQDAAVEGAERRNALEARAEAAEALVHELREAVARRTERNRELEQRLEETECLAPTETRGEWHARRCPRRNDAHQGCRMEWRWNGTAHYADYGPNREFVGKTCAEVYEAEHAKPVESFEDWHARECPNIQACRSLHEGCLCPPCDSYRWADDYGKESNRPWGTRFRGRTCREVYEAEVRK